PPFAWDWYTKSDGFHVTVTRVEPSSSPEARMSMITVMVATELVWYENWAMSAINTGPPGTATTASNESAGELPPSALAVTTACPRVSPVTVPAAETEAAEGFRLTYVTSGFATGAPTGSCTVTAVPAVE